ncbi:hypothetical protein HGRIS_006210 [Hohenbuehelia grisea]|uniref:Small ribosomal subunit protein mS41 n=1 Tax=Hohenbuehelia grisea TaxID=104357 RepID=A0ABR3JZ60_9AGAR
MSFRALQTSVRFASLFSGSGTGGTRNVVNYAAARAVPPTRAKEGIETPEDFLKAIGRSCETKLQVESWEELFTSSGAVLKQKGVDVRDRRYMLWCMEKFRRGDAVSSFAYEAQVKKTIHGGRLCRTANAYGRGGSRPRA